MKSSHIQEFPPFPIREAEQFILDSSTQVIPDIVLSYLSQLRSWNNFKPVLNTHQKETEVFYKRYNIPKRDGTNQDTARPPIPADLTRPLLNHTKSSHQVLLVGAGTGYQSTDHEIMLNNNKPTYTAIDPHVKPINPMITKFYPYDSIMAAKNIPEHFHTILCNGSGFMDLHPSQLISTVVALHQLCRLSGQLVIDMSLLGTADIPAGTKLNSHVMHHMFEVTTKKTIKSGYDQKIDQYHTQHPDSPHGIFYRDWMSSQGEFGKEFFGITQALLYTVMIASGFTPYTSYEHTQEALQILSSPNHQSYSDLLNALRLDHNKIKNESKLPPHPDFFTSITHTMYMIFTFNRDGSIEAYPRSRSIWRKIRKPYKDLLALVK